MKQLFLTILVMLIFNSTYAQVKATSAEINTGTDDGKFATALALQGSKYLDQNGTRISAVTAAGANTYIASIIPAISAYSLGQVFYIKITTANTGASTLNLNGLGAKTLVKDASTALVSGDLLANKVYAVYFDGTNFQVMNAGGVSGGNYLPLTGGILQSGVSNKLILRKTSDTQGNFLQFQNTAGTQTGYIGHVGGTTTNIEISSDAGNINLFSNGANRLKITGTEVEALTRLWGTSASFSGSVKGTNTYIVNGAAGIARTLNYTTNDVLRWAAQTSATAETGGNLGSNYSLTRYSDSGVFIDHPFSLSRATGAATFTSTVTAENNIYSNGIFVSTHASGSGSNGLLIRTGSTNRWFMWGTGEPETGGNNGTNFSISRYSDGGALLSHAFTINRATGNATFSGNVTASDAYYVRGAAGTPRAILYTTDGVSRWAAQTTATAETGSNLGSNYVISRYSDAGAIIDNALSLSRSTGAATFSSTVTAPTFIGNLTGNSATSTLASNSTLWASLPRTEGEITNPGFLMTLNASATNSGRITKENLQTWLNIPVGNNYVLKSGDTMTGNFGIGVVAPTQKLEVLGVTRLTNAGNALQLYSTTGTGNTYMSYHNNVGTRLGYVGFGSGNNNNMNIVSDLGANSYVASAHLFKSSAATVYDNNAIGIGKMANHAAVQIDGFGVGTRGFTFGTEALPSGYQLELFKGGVSAKGITKIERTSSLQYMQIDAEGGNGNILGKNPLTADYLQLKLQQGNSTTNRDVLTVGNDGKVTIPFGVVANVTGNATTATSATKLATPRTINGVSFDGSANITIDAATQASVATLDANAVHKTGNETIAGVKLFSTSVGIGTTNVHSYKLAVGGGIIAESVKVKPQAQWPDYVFEKDYPILPLNELEKFVFKNRHLPNIPNAAEVKKEGIDVGEMNAKLLQKIEELTLYLIDLKKENESLKSRMDKIEKNAK